MTTAENKLETGDGGVYVTLFMSETYLATMNEVMFDKGCLGGFKPPIKTQVLPRGRL